MKKRISLPIQNLMCVLGLLTFHGEGITKTKQQLLADLQQSMAYMEQVAKSDFIEPNPFVPIPPHHVAFAEKRLSNLPHQQDIDFAKLQAFFAQKSLRYEFHSLYTVITLPKDDDQLSQLLGYEVTYLDENPSLRPVLTPTAIIFADGTIETQIDFLSVKQIFDNHHLDSELTPERLSDIEQAIYATKDQEDEQIVIEAYKPIKQVTFSVELPIQYYRQHVLTHAPDQIAMSSGEIQLTQIIGNAILYRLPKNHIHAITSYGLDNKGQVFHHFDWKATTLLSHAEKAYHQQLAKLFKQVYTQVEQDKIKTEAQIRQFFAHYVPYPLLPEESDLSSQVTKYYPVDIDKVVFHVPDHLEKRLFNVTYSLETKKE